MPRKATLVDQISYLLEVSRYIVLNPVRAKPCATVGDWAWSSSIQAHSTPRGLLLR